MRKIKIPTTKDLEREFIVKSGGSNQLIEIIEYVGMEKMGRFTKIIVEPNAELEYVLVLPTGGLDYEFLETREILIGDGAIVRVFYCFLGGGSCNFKVDNHIGRNVSFEQRTLILNSEKQTMNIRERHLFHEQESYGRFVAHGLANDRAKINYDSMIVIDHGAQKVDSRLDLHGFIMGKRSSCVMVPSLQIEANDVKAGHGATVSGIDSDILFYLSTRGISFELAQILVVDGLIHDFMSGFDCEEVKSVILDQV